LQEDTSLVATFAERQVFVQKPFFDALEAKYKSLAAGLARHGTYPLAAQENLLGMGRAGVQNLNTVFLKVL